ncbi:AAA family ATPase [Coleofasciculus sp. H7-2]|uniref:AAA family ATPase n=1 Tax=Coleofasciculus sp. H7-2 TaxID=3351545 RepID=UPI003671090C
MKIKTIEYYNKALDWRLNTVDFTNSFSNLTLLVGVSGVGKTQIIKSILNLKDIANGESLNGVQWDITFETLERVEFRWKGEFESKGLAGGILDGNDEEPKIRIINEYLYKQGNELAKRNNDKIEFKNQMTPKLSPFKSLVDILSEEEDIAPIKEGFDKIVQLDPEKRIYTATTAFLNQFENSSLETIQKINQPDLIKLALVYKYFPGVFQKIKKRFINDIFTQVEDIKVEPEKREDLPISFKNLLNEFLSLKIKEKGVDKWISQPNISSGMFKTLMQISELYLAPEGSVILIDEFENSLGVNCIDVLTEDLLGQNRNLQFIITSHHPYIINNIGMEHWKIVTRRGGVVTVKDAKDFNLGKSRHQAFIQLLNLEAYSEGIAVE